MNKRNERREMHEDLFLVTRDFWPLLSSSLTLVRTSNELTVNKDGIFDSSGTKIEFMKQRHNRITRNLKDLDEKLWTIVVSYSRDGNFYMLVDAYVNMRELTRRVRYGLRFVGRDMIHTSIKLNKQTVRCENYIMEYYNNNLSLDKYVADAFDENVIINSSSCDLRDGLKSNLYSFQRQSVQKMIHLEDNGVTYEMISNKYKCMTSSSGVTVWCTLDDTLNLGCDCETELVRFKGGFLTDSMGMGKTLTLITLCLNRPNQTCPVMMRPRATLVICPSHIVSHWVNEIEKHTNMSYVIVTVKSQIQKSTFGNIMSGLYDFVLVSFNYFGNATYRNQMEYYNCECVNRSSAFMSDFVRLPDDEKMKQYFNPHIFDWGRIIIDEFHELANVCYPNVSAYISSLKGEKVWFVSGTPVVHRGLYDEFVPRLCFGESCNRLPVNDATIKLITKTSVKNSTYDVQIPPIRERVCKIKLSKSERIIYDGIRSEGRDQQLRVCSYSRLAKCLQDCQTEVETIDEMKDVVVKFLTDKVHELEQQVASGIVRIDQLRPLVPDMEARTLESYTLKQCLLSQEKTEKYLNDTKVTLDYVKKAEQKECVICLEEMQTPCVIKTCGHQICDCCLPVAMRYDKKCPICRTSYTESDIVRIDQNCDDKMMQKYGSKLYHLLQLLSSTTEVKTLIFSQWDDLLKDVGRCIKSYNESTNVLFCKGSIMQKNNTIQKFSNDDTQNLLLLSTLNSGSGCDLSIARRVILLDTIDGTGDLISGLERQAISRCHRIGQTNNVEVIRFIAENTIEEELYNSILSS